MSYALHVTYNAGNEQAHTGTLLVHLHVELSEADKQRLDAARDDGGEAYSREAVAIADSHLLAHTYEVVDAEEID